MVFGLSMVSGCGSTAQHSASVPRPTKNTHAVALRARPHPHLVNLFRHPLSSPHLFPGSNPAALPGPILIADSSANRLLMVSPQGNIVWEFPRPGDLAPGQPFIGPDDAFFSPHGRYIVATQESNAVVSVINVATSRIVYQYGTPGVPGSGPNQLSNPDDATMLPNGEILVADIKNCRLVVLKPPQHVPAVTYGITSDYCYHQPPTRWGSPNGAFPMSNGNYVVTEINGDWADELNLNGQVIRQVHPPGVYYPSDINQVRPGVLIVADYSSPGQIVMFTWSGRVIWRFRPTGAQQLNHPSIALPLPNGDILCTDDWNHRVIVIDPRTNKIVWQYGSINASGTAPGLLETPDGIDLAPPFSLMMRHALSAGTPPGNSSGSP